MYMGDIRLFEKKKNEKELGLIWFGFMAHQPLKVINAKSIFIHINSFISNNLV